MRRFKTIMLIFLSYIVVFLAAVIISSMIINKGKISGNTQVTQATLPVVYVKSGGQLMNEMHGYVSEIDAGYYRDTLTAVGDSKTINLSLNQYEYSIASVSFELYNDQYDTLVESGDGAELETSSGMLSTQIVFKSTLSSNKEYCLRIMLTDTQGTVINYYTRVRYGSDLKVSEKLQFVLDFNEATFDKENADQLSSYLESGSTSSSNYSQVTLTSTLSEVTWGSMEPYRTGDIAIRLKEINTETAAFTLSYTVESSAGDVTTFYNVTEYYRIRYSSNKIYLLDFERTMYEDVQLEDVTVNSGAIRIGIGDADSISSEVYGTEEQEYVYVESGGKLWLYDITGMIFTQVYSCEETGHSCAGQDETGIQVVYTDDENGDLYFIVYGYMHSGDFEGQEGVLIYHYSQEDVMLEEIMFIPYTKGFAQLEEGISKLAFMNDDGEMYLMIDDTIYLINISLGRLSVAWTDLDDSNCMCTSSGVVLFSDDDMSMGSSELTYINLSTGEQKSLKNVGYRIKPIGFIGTDLVYGLVDEALISEDSSGKTVVPMLSINIVDTSLSVIKSYESNSSYIIDVDLVDESMTIYLGTPVTEDGYTDYEDAGTEYIVRNSDSGSASAYLKSIKDSTRGFQNWLKLATTTSQTPIKQIARYLDPGYDISKDIDTTEAVELVYYVYTKGVLAATFDNIVDAIDYGNENAGTVMTSHKQILWQRAGRAYIWDLSISSIGKSEDSSENAAIIEAIVSYEKWEISENIDGSLSLFEAMSTYLPAETIDLTGVALTDVQHFVYRNRVVAAKNSESTYVLIIAYDSSYVQLADPEQGKTYWMSWTSAKKLFEEYGNVFYSYID